MSQTKKLHKIQVRSRVPDSDKVMTGASTEILIDGEPFRGITFLKFETKAAKVNKVLIEMFADVEIDADVYPDIKIAHGDETHQIGQYSPARLKLFVDSRGAYEGKHFYEVVRGEGGSVSLVKQGGDVRFLTAQGRSSVGEYEYALVVDGRVERAFTGREMIVLDHEL